MQIARCLVFATLTPLLFACAGAPLASPVSPVPTIIPVVTAAVSTAMALTPSPAPTLAASPLVPSLIVPSASTDPSGGIPERIATRPFPTVSLPATRAPNFALTFGYGSCQITRRLDTFAGTLTQYAPDGTATTIPFLLQPQELDQIYQRVAAIAFFSYPERYTTILPDSMIRVMPSPHPTYEFLVRHDTLLHRVVFEDSVSRPTTTETDNLRDLVRLIEAIVGSHPDLARLPPLQESCA